MQDVWRAGLKPGAYISVRAGRRSAAPLHGRLVWLRGRGGWLILKLRQTRGCGDASHSYDPMNLPRKSILFRNLTLVFCIGGCCVGAAVLAGPTPLRLRFTDKTDMQSTSAPQADTKTTGAQDAADAR